MESTLSVNTAFDKRIPALRARFHFLNLSEAQMAEMIAYERSLPFDLRDRLSPWENNQLDRHFLSSILQKDQWETFKSSVLEQEKMLRASLADHDETQRENNDAIRSSIRFYRDEILPAIEGNILFSIIEQSSLWPKISYLKNEYRRLLDVRVHEAGTLHLRHNQDLQPLGLDTELLQVEWLRVFPNYGYFKSKADGPTLAVTEYVELNCTDISRELDQLFLDKLEQLRIFQQDARLAQEAKQGGPRNQVVINTNPFTDKRYRMMTLLLLDKH